MKREIDDLAYDYNTHREGLSTRAELVGYWHWAYRTHGGIYRQLVSKTKVADPVVEAVRQRLLTKGY
jgi:hypothetical protein